MSALLAAHMTVSIRCKRLLFPNLRKFSPWKSSFLDKILRGPLCNVRAYKVQAPPIGTQAGITWWPIGVLQPIHFILSAIGRQCSSVLSRFKTVQTQTLRKRKIGITLISSPQRNAGCVSKSEYSVSAELVSWSIPVGRSRNTRWRPTPLNPFWKRGEINFIWPNLKLERWHWQQCPIHSWFDFAEKTELSGLERLLHLR